MGTPEDCILFKRLGLLSGTWGGEAKVEEDQVEDYCYSLGER